MYLMPRLHLTFYQERNLIFSKTDIHVVKLIFFTYKASQTKILCLQNETRFIFSSQTKYCASLTHAKNTFIQVFCSVPGYQACMCKRSVTFNNNPRLLQSETISRVFKCSSIYLTSVVIDIKLRSVHQVPCTLSSYSFHFKGSVIMVACRSFLLNGKSNCARTLLLWRLFLDKYRIIYGPSASKWA